MFEPIFHGVFLALGLITPLGLQNIFVFNQAALQSSFFRSLPTVLTAAVCDTILICASVLGISILVLQITWIKVSIFVFGIIFLVYMGFVTWNAKVDFNKEGTSSVLSMSKQVYRTMSVSILNPHAIIDTATVIGPNSLAYSGNERVLFTLACILASWIWFFTLAVAGRQMRRIDTSGSLMSKVNKLSSIVMWTVAFYITTQLYEII